MKNIRLWFTDFYDGFDPENNYFFNHLSTIYSLVLDEENPDFLFFSCYGSNFLKYKCVRIFYTGENLRPDFNLCDYAIGFDYMNFENRYLRYPNFAFFEEQFEKLTVDKSLLILKNKSYFCNFIYSNPDADPNRDSLFKLLNQYKKVDSPGNHLNNMLFDVGKRFSSDWMSSKIHFQSKCKFSIAFENTSTPGYTTEKLLHAFISGTVPIYWGNPEIEKEFNPNAFINSHNYNSFEDVVEKVKQLDNNPNLYNEVLNEPAFRNNIIPENLRKENLQDFLKNIFDQDPKVAKIRPAYGTTANYEKNLKNLVHLKNKVSTIKKRLFLK